MVSIKLNFGSRELWIFLNRSEAAPRTTVIDTAIIKAPPGKGCPRCGGVVFAAEQVLAKGREWHRKCYKCHDCSKTLDSIIACDGPDKDVYCKTCYGKKWVPHGYGFACGSGFLQTDGLTWVDSSSPFSCKLQHSSRKTNSSKIRVSWPIIPSLGVIESNFTFFHDNEPFHVNNRIRQIRSMAISRIVIRSYFRSMSLFCFRRFRLVF